MALLAKLTDSETMSKTLMNTPHLNRLSYNSHLVCPSSLPQASSTSEKHHVQKWKMAASGSLMLYGQTEVYPKCTLISQCCSTGQRTRPLNQTTWNVHPWLVSSWSTGNTSELDGLSESDLNGHSLDNLFPVICRITLLCVDTLFETLFLKNSAMTSLVVPLRFSRTPSYSVNIEWCTSSESWEPEDWACCSALCQIRWQIWC